MAKNHAAAEGGGGGEAAAVSHPHEEIQQKVAEYATFLRNVLRPDFDVLSQDVEATKQEIAEYNDLVDRLGKVQQRKQQSAMDGIVEERVDLGHEKVFCRATMDDPDHLYVHVGQGFHVELTIPEALEYVAKRVRFLSCDVLPYREAKVQKILDHIRSSEMILDQLQVELSRESS